MVALMQALMHVIPHFRTLYAVELGTCQCKDPSCSKAVAKVLPGKPTKDLGRPVIKARFLAFMGKTYFAKVSYL